MSSDNFYLVRRHPDGGFCAPMGFDSDERDPEARPEDRSFATADEALTYALSQYSEYGAWVHPECADDLDSPATADLVVAVS